jgi:hypothetical protein
MLLSRLWSLRTLTHSSAILLQSLAMREECDLDVSDKLCLRNTWSYTKLRCFPNVLSIPVNASKNRFES